MKGNEQAMENMLPCQQFNRYIHLHRLDSNTFLVLCNALKERLQALGKGILIIEDEEGKGWADKLCITEREWMNMRVDDGWY